MFTRVLKSLSCVPKSLIRFSSTPVYPLATLTNTLEDARLKLSNSSNIQEALQKFSDAKSICLDLYPTMPIQQAFWLSQISLILASTGCINESRTYYEEAIALMSKSRKSATNLKDE